MFRNVDPTGRYLAGVCVGIALLLLGLAGPIPASAGSPQAVTGGPLCPAAPPEKPELCGVISLPGGGDVSYYFELGASVSYGEQVPAQPIAVSVPADASVVVRAPLGDLQPGVTYHYRLAVIDGSGTSTGGDVAFTTAPASEPIQSITGGPLCPAFDPAKPQLCGVISAPAGGEISYYFELGPSPGYGEQAPAQPVTINIPAGGSAVVKAPLGGLRPSTTYHYRLVATDGEGAHRGGDAVFATPATEPLPLPERPTVPTPESRDADGGASGSGVTLPLPPEALTMRIRPLSKVLRQCHKRPSRQRRVACEKRVRQRYYAELAAITSG